MAGKFRGEVGKLTKAKKSKNARRKQGKKVVALVKRSPKLAEDSLMSRIAELTSGSQAEPIKTVVPGDSAQQSRQVGRAAIEIMGRSREKVVPEESVAVQRSPAEAIGRRILKQAVRDQSYNRLMDHQNRHDYEYRLRSIATLGVVQLFNSLAQARKASKAVEAENTHLTSDKTEEKKQVVSREAFLEALRQPTRANRY